VSKKQACGHDDCGCSTGIHEGLTFGRGRLDRNGYWEFPCRVCAAEWDKNIRETREQLRDKMIADGNLPLNVIQYILDAEWLWLKAWPLDRTDIVAHTLEAQQRFKREDEDDAEWNRLFSDVYGPTDPPDDEAA
jgi:hypothetical protein